MQVERSLKVVEIVALGMDPPVVLDADTPIVLYDKKYRTGSTLGNGTIAGVRSSSRTGMEPGTENRSDDEWRSLMKQSRMLIAFAVACLPISALAGDFYVYPAKGQDQQQQEKDTYECQQWATQQTGFDPTNLPQAPEQVPADPTAGPRKAVGGAALGAAIGSFSGDMGQGAAWGAAAGIVSNARGRRKHAKQQQAADEQAAGQYAQERTAYDNAYSACLRGRGYTLNPKQ